MGTFLIILLILACLCKLAAWILEPIVPVFYRRYDSPTIPQSNHSVYFSDYTYFVIRVKKGMENGRIGDEYKQMADDLLFTLKTARKKSEAMEIYKNNREFITYHTSKGYVCDRIIKTHSNVVINMGKYKKMTKYAKHRLL